jgi:hypothetical protein
MTLKACSECGGQVSDKAVACPHCGAPGIVQFRSELAELSGEATEGLRETLHERVDLMLSAECDPEWRAMTHRAIDEADDFDELMDMHEGLTSFTPAWAALRAEAREAERGDKLRQAFVAVLFGAFAIGCILAGPIGILFLVLFVLGFFLYSSDERRDPERERREEAKARYWNDRDPKTLEHFPTFIAIRDTLTGRTYDDDDDDDDEQ